MVNVRHVPAETSHNMSVLPDKLVWDRHLAGNYEQLLNSPNCKEVLNGFVQTGVLPNQVSVDSAVNFLSNIIVETAKQAGMQFKKGAVPRRAARSNIDQKRQKHTKWHDFDCKMMLSKLKQTSKFLRNDPKNSFLRGKLITEKRQYTRLVKFKQSFY